MGTLFLPPMVRGSYIRGASCGFLAGSYVWYELSGFVQSWGLAGEGGRVVSRVSPIVWALGYLLWRNTKETMIYTGDVVMTPADHTE